MGRIIGCQRGGFDNGPPIRGKTAAVRQNSPAPISFALLLAINLIQIWSRRRMGAV